MRYSPIVAVPLFFFMLICLHSEKHRPELKLRICLPHSALILWKHETLSVGTIRSPAMIFLNSVIIPIDHCTICDKPAKCSIWHKQLNLNANEASKHPFAEMLARLFSSFYSLSEIYSITPSCFPSTSAFVMALETKDFLFTTLPSSLQSKLST